MGIYYQPPSPTGTACPCVPEPLSPAIEATVYGSLPPIVHPGKQGPEIAIIIDSWRMAMDAQYAAALDQEPNELFGKMPTSVAGITGQNPVFGVAANAPVLQVILQGLWQAAADGGVNAGVAENLPGERFGKVPTPVTGIIGQNPVFGMAANAPVLQAILQGLWQAAADAGMNAGVAENLPGERFGKAPTAVTGITGQNPVFGQPPGMPVLQAIIQGIWQAAADAANAAALDQHPDEQFGKTPTPVSAVWAANPPPVMPGILSAQLINAIAAWADVDLKNIETAAYNPGYRAEIVADILPLFPWLPQGPLGALLNIVMQSWQAAADAQNAGVAENLPGERFGKAPTPVTGVIGQNPVFGMPAGSPVLQAIIQSVWQAVIDAANAGALDQVPDAQFGKTPSQVSAIWAANPPPLAPGVLSAQIVNAINAWADQDLKNLESAAYNSGYRAEVLADLIPILFWLPQGPLGALINIISQSWQAMADAQNAGAAENLPGERFGKVPTPVSAIWAANPPLVAPGVLSAQIINAINCWADADLKNVESAAYQLGYRPETIADLLSAFWMPQGPRGALANIISQSWQAAADAAANAGITEAALVRAIAAGSWFWSGGQLYIRIGSTTFAIGSNSMEMAVLTDAVRVALATKSMGFSFQPVTESKLMQILFQTKNMKFKLN
jgi:hypothetical protein